MVVKQELAKILYPSTDVSFDPVADRPAVPLRRIQSLVSSLMSRHMAWKISSGVYGRILTPTNSLHWDPLGVSAATPSPHRSLDRNAWAVHKS